VINQAVKNFHVPRPARKLRLRRPRFAGFAGFAGMPGAFCNGIVKVLQGSAAEPLQTSSVQIPHFLALNNPTKNIGLYGEP
jgi:hypothetical protein